MPTNIGSTLDTQALMRLASQAYAFVIDRIALTLKACEKRTQERGVQRCEVASDRVEYNAVGKYPCVAPTA